MRFDIITIFPGVFNSYLKESLVKKASEKKKIEVKIHDLRKWADDVHKTVDDTPFGGGGGMVMKAEPIHKAVSSLKGKGDKTRVVLFTPRGRRFNQRRATKLTEYNQVIMICGRYEGVDERVAKYIADEELSIGSYVLMGGELPAMVVLETVSRLVPGVVGKESFLQERKRGECFLECPQYTRPENITINGKKRSVPSVLLSGDHRKIAEWRDKKGKIIK